MPTEQGKTGVADAPHQLMAMGRHALVECYGAPFAALDDLDLIKRAMLGAARAMNVTVLSQHFHRFSPQGVSGAILIAESHLTVHTWPESGYAAVDFFTCGTTDPHVGVLSLARELGATVMKIVEVARGIGAPLASEPVGCGVAETTYRFTPDGNHSVVNDQRDTCAATDSHRVGRETSIDDKSAVTFA